MKLFFAILFLLPCITFAGVINQKCPQFTYNGTPQYIAQDGDQELCKLNYAIIHRCSVKAPIAVFEHITMENITGTAKRKNNFRADLSVTSNCRSTLDDYASVGNIYDRGHMSPAGDNTRDDQIMSESFFLSNMVPQDPNNNRGVWRLLETWVRQWAQKDGTDFFVISGGIYGTNHKVIGNGLGVPDYLYKIIIEKNSHKIRAYMMPNAPVPIADLPKYEVPVFLVEQYTGMKFNLK